MYQYIGEIQIDLVSDVTRKIQLHLESMRRVLHALEAGAPPQERNRQRPVTPPFEMNPIEGVTTEWLKEQQIHSAYQSIVRAEIDFMDLLIGVEEFVAHPQVAKRNIAGQQEFSTYINDQFAHQAVLIGRRRGLSNPKKVSILGGLSPLMESALLSMIEARRLIEHHKSVVEHDFDFVTLQTRVLLDGEMVTELPFLARAGQRLEFEVTDRVQSLKSGDVLSITELDVDEVAMTLTMHIIPLQLATLSGIGGFQRVEP